MDKRCAVERRENAIHFPVDASQQGRYREGEGAVPGPVGGGGEGDGHGADVGGEDFRRVGPGNRTPGDGEDADEKVRARDDAFGHTWMAL